MLPVIQLGPLSIPTYPLALLLAVWLALEVGGRTARRLGLDGDHVYNAGLYGLVAGLLAARLGHVIAYWPAYRVQPLEIFGFNTQAFLPWPGVIGVLAAAGWYIYRRRLPLARVSDAFAPGILVGIAVVQAGALFAGRAYGAAADLPWAVNLWGVPRHPSQIYEALAALIVAALVGRMLRLGSLPAAAALVALAGYGLSRWLLEPFRAESAVILGGLRAAQVWGLALVLAALAGLRLLVARHGQPGDHQPPSTSHAVSHEAT
jgi:phosphatidylglycerol:prolipoprotein diacylglycerol transferase